MYNRMLELITEVQRKDSMLKRWKNIWHKSKPKEDPNKDRRKTKKRSEERGGDEHRRSGDQSKDTVAQTGSNVASAARGGGQTPGSKAVDWANRTINRNKKIGPVM